MRGDAVNHGWEKHIGQVVTIIYADRKNGFTKRRVKLLAAEGNAVKAFCLERMAPRTFLSDSILAVEAAAARNLRSRYRAARS